LARNRRVSRAWRVTGVFGSKYENNNHKKDS
jgi:hypothetical protein